ncbi:MAG TPA: hypothetical protein VHI78_01105 [Bacteroidales bacterium]|nr:hypothetical protein [Bacteroidales bacterium]
MKMNLNNWISDVKQSSKFVTIPSVIYPGIDPTGERVYNAVINGNIHFEAI